MAMERLRWLMLMCNLTGVLPFRMIWLNGRFRGFGFCWKYPAVWWFGLILFIQLAFLVILVIVVSEFKTDLSNAKISMTLLLATTAFQFSTIVEFLSPYLIFFHMSNMKTIANISKEVDRVLDRLPEATSSCTVRFRTTIGILFSFIWTLIITVLTAPFYTTIWPKYLGNVMAGLLMPIAFCLNIKMMIWLLMIHIAYYSVAHRIDVLAALLSSVDGSSMIQKNVYHVFNIRQMENKISVLSVNQSQTTQMMTKKLQTCAHLFDQLSKISTALNSIFSLPILLILVTSFINCTLFLYFTISEFFQPSPFKVVVHGQAVNFVTNIIFMVVLLTAPDMPASKLKQLREKVMEGSNKATMDYDENVERATFLSQLSMERVQLSAAGMFLVGRELVPSLTAAVITYLVILLESTLKGRLPSNDLSRQNISSIASTPTYN